MRIVSRLADRLVARMVPGSKAAAADGYWKGCGYNAHGACAMWCQDGKCGMCICPTD